MKQLREKLNDYASRIHSALGKPVSKKGLQKIVAGAMLIPASVGAYGCSNSIEGKLQENSSINSSQNQIKGYPINSLDEYDMRNGMGVLHTQTEIMQEGNLFTYMDLREDFHKEQEIKDPHTNQEIELIIYSAEIINPQEATKDNLTKAKETLLNNKFCLAHGRDPGEVYEGKPICPEGVKVYGKYTEIIAKPNGKVLSIDLLETTPEAQYKFNDEINSNHPLWNEIRPHLQETFDRHYNAIKKGSEEKLALLEANRIREQNQKAKELELEKEKVLTEWLK